MSYIQIEGLKKTFGNNEVVKGINLKINKGEFISLLGSSGCGKTTILRMIAGFTEPTEGKITIDDTVIYSSSEKIMIKTEKRNLGMVFQSYAVWPHMNIFDNVAYPLKIKKISKNEIKDKVMTMIELVGLKGKENSFPSELSGGQQQRVALARALVMEPSVLLLDEPLSNLDAKLREKMKEEIMYIQRRTGITVIYVTHDQAEALQMSDKIVIMNKGKIEQIGTPEEIYKKPCTAFVADFIGKTNLIVEGDTTISVRPEHITLSKTKKEPYKAEGKLIRKVFQGSKTEYFVETNKGQLLIDSSEYEEYNIGDKVQITWDKQIIFNNKEEVNYV